MINYGKQNIDQSDIKAVIKVLKGNLITQGSTSIEFEKSLSQKFGSKYTSVVSSGTAALHLLGLALGWKKNDMPFSEKYYKTCLTLPIFPDLSDE